MSSSATASRVPSGEKRTLQTTVKGRKASEDDGVDEEIDRLVVGEVG
jgi:hypothetical protein